MKDNVKPQDSSQPLRMRLADVIKKQGKNTAQQLSSALQISYEAVRRELAAMQDQGLVYSELEQSSRGRPTRSWSFTDEGEHLFPKDYDSALGDLLDALSGPKLKATTFAILEQIANTKAEKLNALRTIRDESTAVLSLYGSEDQYISIEEHDGRTVVIERNCPLLKIARSHPMLCSVSTNALAKTFGRKVVRSEKFQNGDGRCMFVVLDDAYENFQLEEDIVVAHGTQLDRH